MFEQRKLQVLYEDNHLIAVNKRSGDISQGDKTGDKPLGDFVKDYIKEKYKKPGDVFLGVIHRIDRPTSGVLLFARTSKALERMNKQFKEKKVQKTYWAITKNAPSEEKGSLHNYLLKLPKGNVSRAYANAVSGSKEASLDYLIKAKSDRYHLLEIKPHTGRHHQIRVQLSKINCPIKGDLKYGADRPNRDRSICLHARAVEFIHPVKKELLRIEACAPEDKLWQAFEKMLR